MTPTRGRAAGSSAPSAGVGRAEVGDPVLDEAGVEEAEAGEAIPSHVAEAAEVGEAEVGLVEVDEVGEAQVGPAGPPVEPAPATLPSVRRRRSRIPLISAIAVGCVTALLVAVLATSKDASQLGTVATSPLQNKPAPDIGGPVVGGGNSALSAYKGKWVVVNFFASWCVPCQQEQADLVKFQNAHPAGDAVIFGVRFDDPDIGAIQDLMNKSGAKWPIVDDPDAKITYSVTGPPESFLISPGGVVLVHIIGPISDAKLEDLLNQAKLVVTTPAAAPVPSTP